MSDIVKDLVIRNFFKLSFALSILLFFIYLMLPFMISIILGGILAMALTPVVDYFCKKGMGRGKSMLLMTFLLFVTGLIPVAVFFIRGSKIITEMLKQTDFKLVANNALASVYGLIEKLSGLYGIDPQLAKVKFEHVVGMVGGFTMTMFSDFMAEVPTMLLIGVVTVLSFYCFLKEAESIRKLFDRYFYFSEANGDRFVKMVKVSCREVFFSNILTGVLQACVVSLGALIFGVGDFFLVFFITFIVSFIPILGAGPVAAVLGIVLFIEGRIGAGIGMMVVAVVSGLSDNIIRPYLASLGEVEVHPLIGLLSVIGGVVMLGLPGLFVGPLAASLVFGALPIIIDEYFPKKEEVATNKESCNLE